MSSSRKGPVPECLRWLKENGHELGALTGQDRTALLAIAHCWELYAKGDEGGARAAGMAARVLVGAMQPHTRPLAKELIAFALDWGDRDRVWTELVAGRATMGNAP